MTTVVPTSEEDPALAVVRFASEFAWADAGPEVAEPQVSRLFGGPRMHGYGKVVGFGSSNARFCRIDILKDLDCIFTVICNLVTKTGSPDDKLEMAKLICAKVTKQPNDKPAFRIKILFNLYNLLEIPYICFHVYMSSLDFALNGKVTELVIPTFKKIDMFLREWNIEMVKQRELFLTICNVLRENKSSVKDSLKFLTKYLETFSGQDAYTLSEAKEEAVNAIIEFVKVPDVYQCDLLNMDAVEQLEKDDKYALVYQLLKIFLTQRLDSYLEFQAANSTILKSYGLVHEDCITKMRLMSLLDLGSCDSREISYSLIKDTLKINEDEVEFWVVKAITSKLMDCKMDQMNAVVIVSRCVNRVFGQPQWDALRTKLATWRGNIGNVITTIGANKIGGEDGAEAQAVH